MIASNHRALNVLFPVSQQGANSLPNVGVDMSNCFMVLEKSDFELLQVCTCALALACLARRHSFLANAPVRVRTSSILPRLL